MPTHAEKLETYLAEQDADIAAAEAALAPDLAAAVVALPLPVRLSILRPLGALARTVAAGNCTDGYWFGFCYGAITGTQIRRELPDAVVSALLNHVSAIYNPSSAEQ